VRPPSPAAQWYRGTSELPLSKFIKVAVSSDLKYLIVSGQPSSDDLLNTWNIIYQEFVDGMQDKKAFARVRLMNEVDKLQYDYRVIQLAAQRLSFGPSDWALEQLRRRVRVTGNFNPEDQAQYYKDLLVVMNQAQSLKHRLAEKQAEIKIVYQKGDQPGRPTAQQFDHLIAQVSLFSKFHINRRQTMTSEFIEYYRGMKRQEEAMQAQLANHKARKIAG
jgi:hypothetical protein